MANYSLQKLAGRKNIPLHSEYRSDDQAANSSYL
jgi:hypothetical protein